MTVLQRRSNSPLAWLGAAAIGYVLLPWFALPDSFRWLSSLGNLFTQQDAATGILQATLFGRWWLWGPLIGLAIAAAGALRGAHSGHAMLLTLGGAVGAGLLLLAGFTIGIQGWSIGWMKAVLPALAQGQYGLG